MPHHRGRQFHIEARVRAADAPAKYRLLLTMLRAQLPQLEVALVGQRPILNHLHRLAIRRPNGNPLSWRIILRWANEEGFPLVHGDRMRTKARRFSPTPSATTSHAVTAWLLSRPSTADSYLYSVWSGQDLVVVGRDAPKPGQRRRS